MGTLTDSLPASIWVGVVSVFSNTTDCKLVVFWKTDDDDVIGHSLCPIVGWCMHNRSGESDIYSAVPIGIESVQGFGWAIVCPDGTVVEPEHGAWDDLDSYLAMLKKSVRKARERDCS